VSSSIVLIGPVDALPGLQERLQPGAEVQTFTESEAIEALDHIIKTKPAVIALDNGFSATPRGAALINRITDDPSLAGCEVRIIRHDSVVAAKREAGTAAVAANEPAPALDVKGTRRAPRIRVKDGVEVAVDGNPAALVDLSAVGAQVVSATVLKPNQRVRVIMGESKTPIRCNGSIAWAAFEMPKGQPTRYRAGIDWGLTADADGVNGFAKKNKKD
jgi:archaeosine-15-forming tRNA-guanine transglycosylase